MSIMEFYFIMSMLYFIMYRVTEDKNLRGSGIWMLLGVGATAAGIVAAIMGK